MSAERVEYVHLPAGSKLPHIVSQPRRTMVLICQDLEQGWQGDVSRWIVASGALYVMAWGKNSTLWDDSVDHANLEQFDYGAVPEEHFVMTTWHNHEPLHEVFFFARTCAFHPTVDLPLLTILDICEASRETAILGLHEAERAGLLDDTLTDRFSSG